MSWPLTRVYTWIVGLGLLAQGSSTLIALLVPAFDRAVPGLLQQTQMVPTHSLLHIGSGLLALAALARSGMVWPWRYAAGLGLFYVGLGIAGQSSGQSLCLGLKPFDHSFHAVLGSSGLLAAGIDSVRAALAASASRRLTS